MHFKSDNSLKEFLNEKFMMFNRLDFIENDPVCIPHGYSIKEDIEIAGFLSASIAWGNRKSIIANARRMMELMDNSPYDFVVNHRETDLKKLRSFVHRTFNGDDFITFIQCLQQLYTSHKGLEGAFSSDKNHENALRNFPDIFFETEVPIRVRKHVAKIAAGSAAKRLNMFLRWMVRSDNEGVDFGIWKSIKQKDLFIPLDVHSGNSARKLGILIRKQNDWKSVLELTRRLRSFDPNDPVKYDFALFGMGVLKKIT